MRGYWLKTLLEAGSAISFSRNRMPSRRALDSSTYSSDMTSRYSSFLYLEPLNRPGRARAVALMALVVLVAMKAPKAAPPMITNSAG
ncbi:hypothetical protein D3C81_1749540 [compost metagenome]